MAISDVQQMDAVCDTGFLQSPPHAKVADDPLREWRRPLKSSDNTIFHFHLSLSASIFLHDLSGPEISMSHGDTWNALIRKYITLIPLIVDEPGIEWQTI
jgi:hypothetical protein